MGREGFEPSKAEPGQIYSSFLFGHLGTDPQTGKDTAKRGAYRFFMPTFDIVSEVDMQEVRNAVDQANREATTRFDFKGTDPTSSWAKGADLSLPTEDRLRALCQVLDEKLVKRSRSH